MGKITKPVINLEGQPKEPSWYLIATIYNNEEFFERNLKESLHIRKLEDKIIECFVPIKHVKLILSTLKNVNLTEDELEKLERIKALRNYVFVKAIMDESVWDYIRTTKGASTILALGGIPFYTPEEEILELKEKVCADATSKEEILKRYNKTEADIKEKPAKVSTRKKKTK